MTRVAVIGPGRVGTLLATALARAGYRLTAIGGGSSSARRQVVRTVAGVRSSPTAAAACEAADLVVLAVPDDAIDVLVTDLVRVDAVRPGQRVVHVSGAHGVEVLRRAALCGAGTAACHPALTVPRGARDPELLVGVAWAVTAAPGDRSWAHRLVGDLGGDAYDLAEDRRGLYHAGLALGANAVGAAVASARQLLLAAGVAEPAAFLAPLVRASVANVLTDGVSALTGPIARGDVGTVARHLEAIDQDAPALAEAYRLLAAATLAPLRLGLDAGVATAIDEVLAREPGADDPGRRRPGRGEDG